MLSRFRSLGDFLRSGKDRHPDFVVTLPIWAHIYIPCKPAFSGCRSERYISVNIFYNPSLSAKSWKPCHHFSTSTSCKIAEHIVLFDFKLLHTLEQSPMPARAPATSLRGSNDPSIYTLLHPQSKRVPPQSLLF